MYGVAHAAAVTEPLCRRQCPSQMELTFAKKKVYALGILYRTHVANTGTGFRNSGRSVSYPVTFRRKLQLAGFRNVAVRKYAVPTNAWPPGKQLQRIGTMMTTNVSNVVDVITLPIFTGVLGWTQPDVESLLADVQRDVGDTRLHAFFTL